MAFSEELKLKVKRQAHFSCCLCHSLGVEVHHIVPQSEDGPDTEENAAPLCPSCHETYGANPQKRKFIREVRDFWYEICRQRFSPDPDRIKRLESSLENMTTKEDLSKAVKVVLDQLTQISNDRKLIGEFPPEISNSPQISSTLLNVDERMKLLSALTIGIQMMKPNNQLEEIHEVLVKSNDNFHQTLLSLSELGVVDINRAYDKVEIFFHDIRLPITTIEKIIFHITAQYLYLIKLAASSYFTISFIYSILDEFNKDPEISVTDLLNRVNTMVGNTGLPLRK